MHGASKPISLILHPRQPWAGGEKVYVCATLGELNGGGLTRREGSRERSKLYNLAKFRGDHESADKLIGMCISDRVIDRIIDDVEQYMAAGVPIICVVPHPPFDDISGIGAFAVGKTKVTNTLPIQYAAQLAVQLEGEIDNKIIQKARVGRTKLTNFPRFLCQPCFEGEIRPDAAYILIDDVVTTGGTLAALRSYIIGNGGMVAASTVLAHGSGQDRPLALADVTWQELSNLYGAELGSFWEREIGHSCRH
jgi:hypothetical protein